jgi:hypothetical protein
MTNREQVEAENQLIDRIARSLEDELEPIWSNTDRDTSDYRRGIGRALVSIRELRAKCEAHRRG